MKPVAILGCGPAGLMAAHCAALEGYPVAIFSKPEKSRLGGAQFLHRPIPDATNAKPDAVVNYVLQGDTTTYRKKVYGDDPTVKFVSMENVKDGMAQSAWNLQSVYDYLWDVFQDNVTPLEITPDTLQSFIDKDFFKLIVSTIPLPQLCSTQTVETDVTHRFTVQEIKIANEPAISMPENTIVYDGTEEKSWYRSSLLFGHGGTEWSTSSPVPPRPNLVTAKKPIWNNCDCFPGVVRLGRFGRWTKGYLTDDGYYGLKEVMDALH